MHFAPGLGIGPVERTLEPTSQVGGRTVWGLMQESWVPGLGACSPKANQDAQVPGCWHPRCLGVAPKLRKGPFCSRTPGRTFPQPWEPVTAARSDFQVPPRERWPRGSPALHLPAACVGPALPRHTVVLCVGFAKARRLPEQVSGSARASLQPADKLSPRGRPAPGLALGFGFPSALPGLWPRGQAGTLWDEAPPGRCEALAKKMAPRRAFSRASGLPTEGWVVSYIRRRRPGPWAGSLNKATFWAGHQNEREPWALSRAMECQPNWFCSFAGAGVPSQVGHRAR